MRDRDIAIELLRLQMAGVEVATMADAQRALPGVPRQDIKRAALLLMDAIAPGGVWDVHGPLDELGEEVRAMMWDKAVKMSEEVSRRQRKKDESER